jgi:hypothetical protein
MISTNFSYEVVNTSYLKNITDNMHIKLDNQNQNNSQNTKKKAALAANASNVASAANSNTIDSKLSLIVSGGSSISGGAT